MFDKIKSLFTSLNNFLNRKVTFKLDKFKMPDFKTNKPGGIFNSTVAKRAQDYLRRDLTSGKSYFSRRMSVMVEITKLEQEITEVRNWDKYQELQSKINNLYNSLK
jgi:hypothetical protein